MGLLRLWLAFCVFTKHAGYEPPFLVLDSNLAVEAFFVISGFYMGLILTGRYQGRTKVFYLNRMLRVYPAYWVVLALALLFYAVIFLTKGLLGPDARLWVLMWPHTNYFSRCFGVFGNLVVLPQALTFFMAFHDGILAFTKNPTLEPYPVFILMLVPQAWSLGIEELYYLMAPWLVKWRNGMLVLVLGMSAALKLLMLTRWNLNFSPWDDKFPLSEFCFFILGFLAQRRMEVLERKNLLERKGAAWRSAIFALALLLYPAASLPYQISWTFLAAGLYWALPWLFTWSRGRAWDRSLGQLSFPLYLVHFLVIIALQSPLFNLRPGLGSYLLALLLSLFLSALIFWGLEKPIEGLRRRLAPER